MLIIDSNKIKTEEVIFGPHGPETWCSKTLISTSNVLVKSDDQLTVSDENGIFVTSGAPSEIALGKNSQNSILA